MMLKGERMVTPADKIAAEKAIRRTLPYQKLVFREFVFDVSKRRKFKPSRHVVSNRKKGAFCRAAFTKKGF